MTSTRNDTAHPLVANSLSSTGYSYNELKAYSILLLCIVGVGFLCHVIILFLLIYQQYMRFTHKHDANYRTNTISADYSHLKSKRFAKTYFFDCNNNANSIANSNINCSSNEVEISGSKPKHTHDRLGYCQKSNQLIKLELYDSIFELALVLFFRKFLKITELPSCFFLYKEL